ncbi:MAG: hypothetical protein JNK05_24155 [Myxococcales bacterium]|nr:hypothetical protein [Myxococcales bacterium]
MEVANNSSVTITNLAFEHCCPGATTVTGLAASLPNNGDSESVQFSTVSGESDYWFISYLDDAKNLLSASVHADFHSASAGSTVEISINPTTVTVTISGTVSTGKILQKNL